MKKVRTVSFFYRQDNTDAPVFENKIKKWLKENYPKVKVVSKKPQLLFVLGGDGAIIEAARKYQRINPLIVGLNLGHVGFLASIREPKKFSNFLEKLFRGNYSMTRRMMLSVSLKREGKIIHRVTALNEIVIRSLIGMVNLEINIEDYPVRRIFGDGVLVASSNGSTAYNLSAHGPIVMPDIKCLIVTELMNYALPTPSIIVKRNREVSIKITGFRKKGLLLIAETGEPADVIFICDGNSPVLLSEGDTVKVKYLSKLLNFVEFDPNYFFKSLQEKFSLK